MDQDLKMLGMRSMVGRDGISYPVWAEQMMAMQKALTEEVQRLRQHIQSEGSKAPDLPLAKEVDDGAGNSGRGPSPKKHVGRDRVQGTTAATKSPAQDRLNRFDRFSQEEEEGNISPKNVQWRAKHVDSIEFPRLDIKLVQNGEDAYNIWLRMIIDAIEEQDCSFLITGEGIPDSYIDNEWDKKLAAEKVRVFLMSHIDIYYQGMVGHLSDPKEILSNLTRLCESNSKTFINTLMQEFARVSFEPQFETPLKFINRFSELIRKIRQINLQVLNEPYVKQTFIGAIRHTQTFQKELDNSAGYSLKELMDMLVDEFDQIDQMTTLDRNLQSGSMFAAGFKPNDKKLPMSVARGKGRGGRDGRVLRGGFRNRIADGASSTANDRSHAGMSGGGISKKVVCYNCGKRGHPYRLCRSKLRKCYNCGQLTNHLSADCPKPKRNPGPSFTPSNKEKKLAGKTAKVPKVVQMKLGDAKKLKERLRRTGQSSTFFIAGDTSLPDTTDTWVLLGDEEKESAMLNHSRERCGQTGMTISEGITPTYFRALIDTGASEHLANKREYF